MTGGLMRSGGWLMVAWWPHQGHATNGGEEREKYVRKKSKDGIHAGAVRSGNINWMNLDGYHIATAPYLERSRILHAQRNSHVMAPRKPLWKGGIPRRIASTCRGVRSLSPCRITHPETHSFHFQTFYQHPTWGWVEELLSDRPPPNPEVLNESFS
ncbi:hypothetical protein PIB30_064001 [Stylosanthes scabra]|uniref:Secreted protein n=1 Tax=Stylosanthes scabra TaxID=79078 RepID=A0ABU6WMA2_9FABA|nr:hypothetical protein [Stylosanthes scabra]